MLSRYRVLAAMATLPTFTIAELSKHSGVPEDGVRSVLRRNGDLAVKIGKDSRKGKGGRSHRYQLAEGSLRRIVVDLQKLELGGDLARDLKLEAQGLPGVLREEYEEAADGLLEVQHLLAHELTVLTSVDARKAAIEQSNSRLESTLETLWSFESLAGPEIRSLDISLWLQSLAEAEAVWTGAVSPLDSLTIRQRGLERRVRRSFLWGEDELAEMLEERLMKSLQVREKYQAAPLQPSREDVWPRTNMRMFGTLVSLVPANAHLDTTLQRDFALPVDALKVWQKNTRAVLPRTQPGMNPYLPSVESSRANSNHAASTGTALALESVDAKRSVMTFVREHHEDYVALAGRAEAIFSTIKSAIRQQRHSDVVEYAVLLSDWLCTNGEWHQVKELLDNGVEAAATLKSTDMLIAVLVERCVTHAIVEDFEAAKRDCVRLIELISDPASAEAIRVAAVRTDLAMVEGDHVAAKEIAREAWETAQKRPSLGLVASHAAYKYAYQLREEDPAESERLLRASIALSEEYLPNSLEARKNRSYSLAELGRKVRLDGKLDEAERILVQALESKRENRDRRSICIGLEDLADLRSDQGRHVEALTLNSEARDIARNMELPDLEKQVIRHAAHLYSKMDTDSRLKPAGYSLAQQTVLNDKPILAEILALRGRAEIDATRFPEAVDTLMQAVEIQRAIGGTDLYASLRLLAAAYEGLPEEPLGLTKARVLREEALTHASSPAERVTALMELGRNARYEQKIGDSIEYHDAAIGIARTLPGEWLPVTLMSLAESVTGMLTDSPDAWPAEAGKVLPALEEALSLRRDPDLNRSAICYAMGDFLYQKGATADAIRLLEQAAEIERSLNSPRLARTLWRLGNAFAASDDKGIYNEANDFYTEALGRAEHAGFRATILHDVGVLAHNNNDMTRAVAALSESATIKRSLERRDLPITLWYLGQALERQGGDEAVLRAREAYTEGLACDKSADMAVALLHSRGLLDLANGRPAEGIESLVEEVALLRTSRSDLLGDALVMLGSLILRYGMGEGVANRAKEFLLEALDLELRQETRGHALFNLGEVAASFESWEEAVAAFGEAVDRLVDEPEMCSISLRKLGNVLERVGDPDSLIEAERSYARALNMSKNDWLRAVLMHDRGDVAFRKQKYAKAIKWYEQSSDAQRACNVEHLSITLRKLGNAYAMQGNDLKSAQRSYVEALERTNDKALRAVILHDLGSLAFMDGNFARAVTEFRESANLKRASRNSNLVVTIELLGHALERVGDHAEAAKAYDEALSLVPTDASFRASLLRRLAGVQFEQEKFEQALASLTQAELLADDASEEHRIQTLRLLGRTHLATLNDGNPEALKGARAAFEDALALVSRSSQHRELRIEFQRELARIDLVAGNRGDALRKLLEAVKAEAQVDSWPQESETIIEASTLYREMRGEASEESEAISVLQTALSGRSKAVRRVRTELSVRQTQPST